MLSNQKSLFSLPEGLHFLNCASRAPLLERAQALGMAGLKWQIAPLSVGPDEYARESEELRRAVAGLINTSPERIAITPSVSYGVAIAAHNLRLGRGRNVVCMQEEFPSDVYAWMVACRAHGAELRSVARPEETARVSSLWNERLLDAEPFEYHWSNRAGSHDTTAIAYRHEYEKGARRFDVGEHANAITVPMLTEGVRQATLWGGEAIQDYCTSLCGPLARLLDDQRFSLAPASQRLAHIIGIRLADASRIPGVMQALGERQVRVSRRGQSIRISPHVYNTPQDIDALMEGLMAGLR